eukprot:scaffold870_cov268-Pinguiococcus_pyrenoidosus.AAC.67
MCSHLCSQQRAFEVPRSERKVLRGEHKLKTTGRLLIPSLLARAEEGIGSLDLCFFGKQA